MKTRTFILEVCENKERNMQIFFLRDPKTGIIADVSSNVDDFIKFLCV